jgi:putative hydrolase of the HAD superfamily
MMATEIQDAQTKPAAKIRAILTDVDGTLYRHNVVRRAVLGKLLWNCVSSPVNGYSAMKAISAYRKSQEELRTENFCGDVGAEQLARACKHAGVSSAYMTQCVNDWMNDRPLPLVAGAIFPDLQDFIKWARDHNILLAAVSDYDPRRKLQALGLDQYFSVIVCAQDPDVGRFKPDPRGLQIAIDKLGVRPDEALYVGDREDVDVAAAHRAGVQAVLLTSGNEAVKEPCLTIRCYDDLRKFLERAKQ